MASFSKNQGTDSFHVSSHMAFLSLLLLSSFLLGASASPSRALLQWGTVSGLWNQLTSSGEECCSSCDCQEEVPEHEHHEEKQKEQQQTQVVYVPVPVQQVSPVVQAPVVQAVQQPVCTTCYEQRVSPVVQSVPVQQVQVSPVVQQVSPVVQQVSPVVQTAPVVQTSPVVTQVSPVYETSPVTSSCNSVSGPCNSQNNGLGSAASSAAAGGSSSSSAAAGGASAASAAAASGGGSSGCCNRRLLERFMSPLNPAVADL